MQAAACLLFHASVDAPAMCGCTCSSPAHRASLSFPTYLPMCLLGAPVPCMVQACLLSPSSLKQGVAANVRRVDTPGSVELIHSVAAIYLDERVCFAVLGTEGGLQSGQQDVLGTPGDFPPPHTHTHVPEACYIRESNGDWMDAHRCKASHLKKREPTWAMWQGLCLQAQPQPSQRVARSSCHTSAPQLLAAALLGCVCGGGHCRTPAAPSACAPFLAAACRHRRHAHERASIGARPCGSRGQCGRT
eukprot:365497-Chlamydomonas_euryale.AAC.2